MSPTNDPRCDMAFAPRLCIMRHRAGVVKIQRGLSESEKCAICPAIIEYLEENKMTENENSKTTKCVVCGREGLKIAARGMCKKCYYQAIKSGDKTKRRPVTSADKPNANPAAVEEKTAVSETRTAETETNAPATSIIFVNSASATDPVLSLRIVELEKECERLRLWVDRLTKAVAA